jgi:hypothetical protein
MSLDFIDAVNIPKIQATFLKDVYIIHKNQYKDCTHIYILFYRIFARHCGVTVATKDVKQNSYQQQKGHLVALER